MKRRYKYPLILLGAIVILVVIMIPEFVKTHHETENAKRVLADYTAALVARQYDEAYSLDRRGQGQRGDRRGQTGRSLIFCPRSAGGRSSVSDFRPTLLKPRTTTSHPSSLKPRENLTGCRSPSFPRRVREVAPPSTAL